MHQRNGISSFIQKACLPNHPDDKAVEHRRNTEVSEVVCRGKRRLPRVYLEPRRWRHLLKRPLAIADGR